MPSITPLVCRAALLLTLVAGLSWATAPPARQLLQGGPLDFQSALAAYAAGTAWVVVLWFCGCVALALLGKLPGTAGRAARHVAATVTPALVRRLIEAVLGASIAVGTTGQLAYATAGAPARTHELPRLDRPDRPDHSAVHQPPAPDPDRPDRADDDRDGGHATRARTVQVRPGDTLWAIASAHLRGAPDNAAIAASWPRWYAANRRVIGPDPDLILPGQHLRPPEEH